MDGTAVGDDRANYLIQQQGRLKAIRGNWENLWTSAAQRILPNYDDFIKHRAPGQRRTDLVFDSTAPLALEKFCAAMESILCPATQRWHRLRCIDYDLENDRNVQLYLDQVNDCLFRARYSPKANFQSQAHEYFSQLGAFGTGPFLVDDILGQGIRYKCLHLAEIYIEEDAAGTVDTVYRWYDMTAHQAMQLEQSQGWKLPKIIGESAKRDPTRTFKFLHAVYPNEDFVPWGRDRKGMRYTSCHVCVDSRSTCKESGYYTMPIIVGRYQTAANEAFGRGPGINVLPDILMLNEMEKTNIRMAQRQVEPPILLADDGALNSFSLRGNAMNYNMVSPEGKPLAIPFNVGGNFQIAKEFTEQKRALINEAFFVTIFQVLLDDREMTATEVIERTQEKGALLAPIMGRQQSEWCGRVIERELDILSRSPGALPPMPDKLRGRPLNYKVEYQNEIVKVQKQGPALGILRSLQAMAPIAQINPQVMRRVNGDNAMKHIFDANDVPTDCLYSDEELAQMDQAAATQQGLTNLAQIAGPASQAIKNLAQAQAASGTPTPGGIPGV